VSVCEELVEDIHQGGELPRCDDRLDGAIAWGRKASLVQVFTSLPQSGTYKFETNNLDMS